MDGKSNESTVVPKLLELLALEGTVFTADAMHCQRQVAQQVIDQSADYVLELKVNQGTLNDYVRLFLDDPANPVAEATQTSKGHRRVETRTARISDDVACLAAGNPPVAWNAGGGQGNRRAVSERPNQYRPPLIPAEPSLCAGAVQ